MSIIGTFFNYLKGTIKIILFSLFIVLWALALVDKTYRTVFNMPSVFWSTYIDNESFCWLKEDELGLQTVDVKSNVSYDVLYKENSGLYIGGKHAPPNCKPFQDVAIIIPYRDREKHLKILLHRLHPMLRRQKLKYQIFVVEQDFSSDFNRGMLMNVGVIEALKINPKIDCFIFHDVDLLPENDKNVYLCDNNLRGFTSAVNENRYHLTFENYGGGVTGMSKRNFFKINGFPNVYWGWGSEDDDYSARTWMLGLGISRPPPHIGRYTMVRHVKADRASTSYARFSAFRGRQMLDGLSSLTSSSYRLLGTTPNQDAMLDDQKDAKPSIEMIQARLFTKFRVALSRNMKMLNESIIAIMTRDEIRKLNDTQLNNKPSNFPPSTEEGFFWFLHFYSWLGF